MEQELYRINDIGMECLENARMLTDLYDTTFIAKELSIISKATLKNIAFPVDILDKSGCIFRYFLPFGIRSQCLDLVSVPFDEMIVCNTPEDIKEALNCSLYWGPKKHIYKMVVIDRLQLPMNTATRHTVLTKEFNYENPDKMISILCKDEYCNGVSLDTPFSNMDIPRRTAVILKRIGITTPREYIELNGIEVSAKCRRLGRRNLEDIQNLLISRGLIEIEQNEAGEERFVCKKRKLELIDVEILSKDLFEDIVIYSYATPGAMGPAGQCTFVNKKGQYFHLCYLNEATSLEKIKYMFPEFEENVKWSDLSMGYGNSLSIRTEIFDDFCRETNRFCRGILMNVSDDIVVPNSRIGLYQNWMHIAEMMFGNKM